MTDREIGLTREQEEEYRQLKQRLHELHPDHGHARTVETSYPRSEQELNELRNEVAREERKQREQVPDRGRGGRDDGPEIDDDHDMNPF